MLQFFKQGLSFSLDAFNRMLGSNMAADITEPLTQVGFVQTTW